MPLDATGFIDPEVAYDLLILQRARDLLARENGWCQIRYRKRSDTGEAYCAVGAVRAQLSYCRANTFVKRHLFPLLPHDFVARTWEGRPPAIRHVTMFNDTHPKADVLDLFDRAIAKLEASYAF